MIKIIFLKLVWIVKFDRQIQPLVRYNGDVRDLFAADHSSVEMKVVLAALRLNRCGLRPTDQPTDQMQKGMLGDVLRRRQN